MKFRGAEGSCVLAKSCLFKLLYLLLEIFVKVAFDNCGVWLLQLISVKINEYGLNIIDQLVDPREVKK